jgi:hypothetical protein
MKTQGRNDLCKCGSGLKYKKCCINKNQEILNEPQVDLNNSFVKKFLQGGSHSEIMKNKESLEGLLNESKNGNGTYSTMISENSFRNEFIELINKSIIPDENKGLVNMGTSMIPNIYSMEDTPIWIIGDMGSVWFDCKTSDGDFWRISLEERKFFHVEDLQYYFLLNKFEMFSQINGKPIPKREEIHESIIVTKVMCEILTEIELNGNEEIRLSRDLTVFGKDVINSTIRKVSDGFEYHDKNWGTNHSPRLYKDIDRLIWEFELPKKTKDSVIKLKEVTPSKKIDFRI